MLALVQRVAEARVVVDACVVGEIGPGLLAFLCAERGDGAAEGERLLAKLLKLRIFPDAAGRMNRSVQDAGGGLLIVSQFTLAADTSGGNRPSFANAAAPEDGRRLYEDFVRRARDAHPEVATGVFGAMMQVHLINDGPVTVPLRIPPSATSAMAGPG